jgi:hypothetical protein
MSRIYEKAEWFFQVDGLFRSDTTQTPWFSLAILGWFDAVLLQ